MQLPFIFCTSRHLFPAVVHTYCVNSSNFLSQSDAMPDFVLLFLFQFLSIQQSLHLLFLLFHIHRHAFLCSILTGVDIRPASCFCSDNPVCIYRHHIGVRAGIRRLIAGRYRRIYSCTFPRMKCNRRLLKCNLWRSDRHFTIFADSMRSFPFDSRYLFGITFSLWHASIVNFSSSCAVFKNSIADVLLFLAKTLIFFPYYQAGQARQMIMILMKRFGSRGPRHTRRSRRCSWPHPR